MSWFRRIANLVGSRRYARDLEKELAFHLAERADELEAGGLPRAAAEAEARRRFGNRTGIAERTHDVDVLTGLESLAADLRYALRSLRLSPGFTAVAVLSLGLGIGANTAIFSLVNAVILRSLPVERPDQLVNLALSGGNNSFTNPLWEQVRARQDVLGGALAYGTSRYDLSNGGPVQPIEGEWVSGEYFSVLGVRAAAGRLITGADDVRGCPPVAVVGAGFAGREYGGPAAAVGRTITLNGHPFSVIGVTDPAFSGMVVGRQSDVYTPLCAEAVTAGERSILDRRSTWWLNVMVRRADSVSLAGLATRLLAASPPVFAATLPENWSASRKAEYLADTLQATPAAAGLSGLRDRYHDALMVLLVVVAVVLAIACANVAHLLLARAAARQREMAIRLAMGAGRGRLIRQLLTESVLLSGLGAAAGLLFAQWASRLLVRMLASDRGAVWLDLAPDARVLGFTIAVAVLTGILFGLAPAWRATAIEPQAAMKAQGRGIVEGGSRLTLGRALLVGQVALSLLLVVAAGLLVGSFRSLVTMDPGFRRDGVLLVDLGLARTGFDAERRQALHREMLERLRGLPGVRSASASLITPLGGVSWNDDIEVEGIEPERGPGSAPWFNGVSEGFLSTYGTELVAGRDFTAADGAGAPQVAIVNESVARRFFGGASPLGRTFRTRSGDALSPPVTIVGVVRDAKYGRLTETSSMTIYRPLYQAEWFGTSLSYSLRTDLPPSTLTGVVTAAVAAVDRRISLRFTTLADQVAATLGRPRLLALLSGFFGALAVLLAVVGLYGTMAYGVARRRTEIGIRLALGAARRRVIEMVLAEAGRVVVLGLVVGLAAALASTRLIRSLLFGLSATDARVLALAAALLGLAALAAAAIPAWRASRLDPMVALRED